MNFLNSPALVLLVLVPFLVILLRWRFRVRKIKLERVGETDLVSSLLPSLNTARYVVKSVLWLLALISVIIALARPVWGLVVDTVEAQGVSIYFVLDVSRSMDAEDLTPSRLERAKLDLRQAFQELNGNALGLVLFAGSTYILFPLTTDSTSLPAFINAVSTSAISGQGSNIEDGLRLAMDSFKDTIKSQRIIVLLSDGEELEGDASTLLTEAVEQDIAIYTIGYGGFEGTSIPLKDQNGNIISYKTDAQGNLVLTKLEEQSLKMIAQSTGGTYFRADAQGSEITGLTNALRAVAASDLGSTTQTRSVEHFDIFVAIALIALTIEMLLPVSSKRHVS